MASRALPFLTFQPPRTATASEAMAAYASLFADGEVSWVQHREGSEELVAVAEFVVAGQRLRGSDSSPVHAWDVTPAVSLFVECGSTSEQARLFTALGEGGSVSTPLDDDGFGPFARVQDRFGVSWQLVGPA